MQQSYTVWMPTIAALCASLSLSTASVRAADAGSTSAEPAVDPRNALALEQVNFVIAVLGIVAQRLPLTYRYGRDELSRFLALGAALSAQCQDLSAAGEARQRLAASMEFGRDVLERARAEPAELERANFELRATLGDLITAACADADGTALQRIGSTVTTHAKGQLLRERSWLIGQGWEAEPDSVPAIETLIGPAAVRGAPGAAP